MRLEKRVSTIHSANCLNLIWCTIEQIAILLQNRLIRSIFSISGTRLFGWCVILFKKISLLYSTPFHCIRITSLCWNNRRSSFIGQLLCKENDQQLFSVYLRAFAIKSMLVLCLCFVKSLLRSLRIQKYLIRLFYIQFFFSKLHYSSTSY